MIKVTDSLNISALATRLGLRTLAMKQHRVFGLIKTVEDLRIFMSWHVFAVWDFMSLVKRLQIEYTSIKLPWCPPKSTQAARHINEIVLGEETDITALAGQYCSHYELYLNAMEEIGAPTDQIRQFVELVSGNMPYEQALQMSAAPPAVQAFVKSTINLSLTGRTEEVLGGFLYGREDAIPGMFQNLLDSWNLDAKDAPTFVFYLKRHIELDTDSHGPAATRLTQDELQDDQEAWIRMLSAANAAVNQRIMLWDALADVISGTDSNNVESISTLHDPFQRTDNLSVPGTTLPG